MNENGNKEVIKNMVKSIYNLSTNGWTHNRCS